MTDTINAVNARTGITDDFWEHRSFKEQGLDILPQIHLGEKASALERAGVHTIRGDINRESNNDIDYCNKISKDGYYKPEEIVLMPIPGSGSKEFLFCVKMYCEM